MASHKELAKNAPPKPLELGFFARFAFSEVPWPRRRHVNLADKKGARYLTKNAQGEPCPQVSSTRISSKEKMHKLFLALALGSAAAVDVTADAAKL